VDVRAAARIIAFSLGIVWGTATGQSPTPEQIQRGASIYARNCSPCHGARMMDPQGAFDLRKFPHDQRERFMSAVLRGKNQMPAWGESLKPEELEALWAYVVSAESIYGH
jgi:mono/diheme cytochrome c family protein